MAALTRSIEPGPPRVAMAWVSGVC